MSYYNFNARSYIDTDGLMVIEWDRVPGVRSWTVQWVPNRPPILIPDGRRLRGPRWRKARRHLRRQAR